MGKMTTSFSADFTLFRPAMSSHVIFVLESII